jgi:hypothetical protein|tara:strand:+ start:98 stop:319 length:222 start_codon:yes stop_codon:yes gene_type:complete
MENHRLEDTMKLLFDGEFEKWVERNVPNAKVSGGHLKVLIGSMWCKFYDVPEIMQRGVFEDFKKEGRPRIKIQ